MREGEAERVLVGDVRGLDMEWWGVWTEDMGCGRTRLTAKQGSSDGSRTCLMSTTHVNEATSYLPAQRHIDSDKHWNESGTRCWQGK